MAAFFVIRYLHMDQTQIDYVKNELARGVTPEALSQTLLQAGYTESQVSELLSVVQVQHGQNAQPTLSTPAKKGGLPTWVWIVLGIVGGLFVIGALFTLVVTSSLNDARDKAKDASAKVTLNLFRSTAELYYDSNNFSYAGFCDSSETKSRLASLSSVECLDSAEQYKVSAKLLTDEFFCVDSFGRSKILLGKPAGMNCE